MIPKKCIEKNSFLLLFFEHAYLTNPHMCSLEILSMHWKRSDLVNCLRICI